MRLALLLGLLGASAASSAAAAALADPAVAPGASSPSCATSLQGLRSCLQAAGPLSDTKEEQELAVARCLAQAGTLGSACLQPALEKAQRRRRHRRQDGLAGGKRLRDDDDPEPQPSACRAAIEAAAGTAAGYEALLASGRVALTLVVASQVFQEFNATGDASGLGYLFYGHDVSLGSPDNCKAIPGFHYCWATLESLPFAKAGACVPDTCSVADLAALVQEVGNATGNAEIAALDLHQLHGQCGDFRFPALAGTYVMLGLVLLLAALVVGGTWMDHRRLRQKEDAEDARAHEGYSRLADGEAKLRKGANGNGNGGGGGDGRGSEEKDALLGEDDDVEKQRRRAGAGAAAANGNGPHQEQEQQHKQGLGARVLSCFSLYRTLPSLLGPARPGSFNALDGIRVFSMAGVVLGHIYAFPATLIGYTNQDAILPPDGILGTYSGQIIWAAEYNVDTFYCIGAFVAAYMLAVHLTKAKAAAAAGRGKPLGWSWIPSLYLHRWLRLTPTYFFVIGCYYYLMRVVDQGPWWGLLENDYALCAKYWWTNLLYINTLYPWGATLDMCYPVSWYMSVDFQLFLLLPFLVLAYVYNKRLGYLVPALLWAASIAYTYVLGYVYDTSEFALSTDVTQANRYQTDYYFRAWTRAPVYLQGLVFAFFWLDFTRAREEGVDHWLVNTFASNVRKRVTAPVAALFGAAFLLLGLTAYGSQPAYHDGGLPKFWDVAYLALSRPAWCVGLLLLCFLLFDGYGGPVKALLENRAMAVLSRLTFCAYLIHPALIFLVFQDGTLPVHYSTIWISFHFMGMLTAVFAFSALCFLLVEKPLANLERALLSPSTGKKGK